MQIDFFSARNSVPSYGVRDAAFVTPEKLINVAEAAEMLSVSERFIRELIKNATESGFPVRRVYAEIRFLPSELLAWTANHAAKHQSTEEPEEKISRHIRDAIKRRGR